MHFLVHTEEHYLQVKFHGKQSFFQESQVRGEKGSCIIPMFKYEK